MPAVIAVGPVPSTTQVMSKDPSASNTPAESSTPASALSGADIDRLLNREASAIQRELEVERILIAFKLKSVFLLFLRGHYPDCLHLTVSLAAHMIF